MNFSDEFIRTNNALILSQWKVKPSYAPDKKTAEKSAENPKPGASPPKETVHKSDSFGDSIKGFLMAVYHNEYRMTLTPICIAAGLPAGTGSRIAEVCVKRNLIIIIQLKFGRGRPKYPVLLPDGYALLGVQPRIPLGRGAGYEHTLYQHLIEKHFKEFKPTIELNRNDKFIDVAIESYEGLICIEVAMTAVHEAVNIEKDIIQARAQAVIVACLDEKVLTDVRKIIPQIAEEYRIKTQVMLIQELLKMNPEKLLDTIQPQLSL
jgi:hypothetical protein